MKRKELLAAIFIFSLLLAGTPPALSQDDPNLPEPPNLPGTVEGTGTYFEVNDSNYLNITLQSSEPVHLMLESVPERILMDIAAANDATSTWITLTGFVPSTTYYSYEDSYHDEVAFTADSNGSYTYEQDLTQPHLVFIQPQPGTRFIPSDTSIGTWDPNSRTYTLTTDVNETIQIDEDDLTLDGAGHMVVGAGTGSGIYAYTKTGLTIKDVNVQGFSDGIYLSYSSNSTLTANVILDNYTGIHLYHSNGNTLTNNTTNSNTGPAISISLSSNNTVTGNTASSTNHGIFLSGSTNNTVADNTASDSAYGIWLESQSDENTLTGNTASNNYYGVYLTKSSDNTLTDNTLSSNTRDGIYMSRSDGSVLTNNTLSSNSRYGIYLYLSNDSQVYNNNFISNATQARDYGGSGNVFNLDIPVGGNHWDNWTSPDANGDGFVDDPYVFAGGQDDFPWVDEDGWVPDINVSPLSHDFGDVEVGTSRTAVVTISNLGGGDLTVSDIALAAGDTNDYSITSAPNLPAVVEVNDTVDVEVTFTPSVLGLLSVDLEISSDDPDEPLVVVEFDGLGISSEIPPSEQIALILAFFDESVDAGTLTGRGKWPCLAALRLRAMRFMLAAAGELINGGYECIACCQLKRAYRRCDGKRWPPDFVEGEATSELAGMIQDLRESMECN